MIPSIQRMRPLFASVCLVVADHPCLAQEPSRQAAPLIHLDVKHPLLYSTSLMAIGLPLLAAVGTYDHGPSINRFERAFRAGAEWENGSPFFNYALHPLWESETYLRAREGNFGILGSIGFSLGMSATWEFLYESWFQQPSQQDLLFTTGIGWTLGELRYRLKQRSSDRMNWILDPIHKTLEHFNVVVSRDHKGNAETTFALSFTF